MGVRKCPLTRFAGLNTLYSWPDCLRISRIDCVFILVHVGRNWDRELGAGRNGCQCPESNDGSLQRDEPIGIII